MTILTVRHLTVYRYRTPVRLGEHRMLFRPRESYNQRLVASDLVIDPQPTAFHWLHDAFTNCMGVAHFEGETKTLRFESRVVLEHAPSGAPDVCIEEEAKYYPFPYPSEEAADLAPYRARAHPDPEERVDRWVRQFLRRSGPTPTGELLKTITYAIKDGFAYSRRLEPGTWEPTKTLQLGRGSCRDFALLMIEAVRALGLAARFVSGYIYVPDRDRGVRLGGGSTHAWCEVYLPGAGWVEFDPTNGIVGNTDLIRVAVARDPAQAVPLSGVWFGERRDFLDMRVRVNVSKDAHPGPDQSERGAANAA
jgi:transglutaminase-like putative cysteine protease